MGEPGRKPRVSNEEILNVFAESNDPVLTTGEVSDELSIGHRATYSRLVSLRDDGIFVSKQTGSRNMVWWVSEDYRFETDEAD